MPAVMKKPQGEGGTRSAKPAPKAAKVASEVDVLIARLKKIRKGQRGGIDVRQAIEDGRD